MVWNSLTWQLALGVTEQRARRLAYSTWDEGEKKKNSRKKATTINMGVGAPLPRSKEGVFHTKPEDCKDHVLKPRSNGKQHWFTCTKCGSRWERTDQKIEQRGKADTVPLPTSPPPPPGMATATSPPATPQCPRCKIDMLLKQNREDKSFFRGCANFPSCRTSQVYAGPMASTVSGTAPGVSASSVVNITANFGSGVQTGPASSAAASSAAPGQTTDHTVFVTDPPPEMFTMASETGDFQAEDVDMEWKEALVQSHLMALQEWMDADASEPAAMAEIIKHMTSEEEMATFTRRAMQM